MTKRLSLVLVLVLVIAAMAMPASLAEMTDVGTPRAETLICEPDADVNSVPGQFNPYMTGTPASWGMHQIMWAEGLWEINTMTGETIPTVAEIPTHNDDFTEWTITIKQGLKWCDGETLDANDVYFTFNTLWNTPELSQSAYFQSLFSGMELVDDYTLKLTCLQPFTRLTTTLGVSTWGCGNMRVLPEHVYKDQDILTFLDTDCACAADMYKVSKYDDLGTWILYEKRADPENSITGKLYPDCIETAPKYVLYRVFGNTEARVMAMISNQVDVMNEVSYEDLLLCLDGNDKVQGWYADYPYANTDDACSKGVCFNCGVEPFNNVNVRWALTLCCNWIEVSENIFEGIGRMSPLQVPSVTAMEINYTSQMVDWLNSYTIPGTEYTTFNPNFAMELRDALVADYGYDLAGLSEEEVKTMFGVGYFKTDVEAATALLQGAGLELKDGKWYFNGEPWTIEILCHPEDSSTQAARSAKAIGDQWMKFGINVEITTLNGTDLDTRVNLGDFQCSDNWPCCSGYTQDFYNNITGWQSDLYNYPIGETATGISAFRFPQADPETAAQITEIVKSLATMDPKSEECHAASMEFLKLAYGARVVTTVQAGTKIVPINTTYWTGFQTASNPYEGPWWWWSCMRFTVAQVKAAQ